MDVGVRIKFINSLSRLSILCVSPSHFSLLFFINPPRHIYINSRATKRNSFAFCAHLVCSRSHHSLGGSSFASAHPSSCKKARREHLCAFKQHFSHKEVARWHHFFIQTNNLCCRHYCYICHILIRTEAESRE